MCVCACFCAHVCLFSMKKAKRGGSPTTAVLISLKSNGKTRRIWCVFVCLFAGVMVGCPFGTVFPNKMPSSLLLLQNII